MPFNYNLLDGVTRSLMAEEIHYAIDHGALYISPRLTPQGAIAWQGLLEEAALYHDEAWLASQLVAQNLLVLTEGRQLSGGRMIQVKVRKDANEMLAEGEFTHYYMRAICLRAAQTGRLVGVYRANNPATPRPESQALLGTTYNANGLLNDLRSAVATDYHNVFRLPPGAHSGLCLEIV